MPSCDLRSELGPAPRILIVRLSALGDVVHGLPVLCALRRQLPSAQLAWVVEERAAAVLQGHAALDRLICVPRGWLKSPRAVWRLRRELSVEHFDVSIDLQSLTKSAIAARLSGARWRIGAGGRDGRELSKWFNNDLVPIRASHVIDHYLTLLRPLGIVDARVQSEVCPMFFRLGTGHALQRTMEDAGLDQVKAERLSTTLEYDSADDACGAAFAGGPVALAYSRFDEETAEAARAEYLKSIAPYKVGDGYAIAGEFVAACGTSRPPRADRR